MSTVYDGDAAIQSQGGRGDGRTPAPFHQTRSGGPLPDQRTGTALRTTAAPDTALGPLLLLTRPLGTTAAPDTALGTTAAPDTALGPLLLLTRI